MRRALLILGVVLYRLGLASAIISLSPRRLRTVFYHCINDADSVYLRGLGMSLDTNSFKMHVRYYKRFYNVVPASALNSKMPTRSLLITFDDGYAALFNNAWPILQQHSLPAVVYLVECAVLGKLIWINELNRALAISPELVKPLITGLPDAKATSNRKCVLHVQEHYTPTEIALLMRSIRQLVPEEQNHALYLSQRQIKQMQAGGIEFGYHTRDHFNLRNCEIADIEQQINPETLGPLLNLNSFAYPFGYYNPLVMSVVNNSDYATLMTVGSNNQYQHSRHINRTDVPYSNEAWLFAQLEVAEPVISLLRRLFS